MHKVVPKAAVLKICNFLPTVQNTLAWEVQTQTGQNVCVGAKAPLVSDGMRSTVYGD